MQIAARYITTVLVIILMAGCHAGRRGKTAGADVPPAASGYSAIINTVLENNFSGKGFEIRKGSVELDGTEIEGKFGLHARLNSRGDFYASVRGPLGIEILRLLMVGNDLAAIDRFNRTVYVGKKDVVLKKNGLPGDFMKILFGDLDAEAGNDIRSSEKNSIRLFSEDENFKREILVSLIELKVIMQRINATSSGHEVYLNFNNYVTTGGVKYPSEIIFEEREKMFHVKLLIDELNLGYDSDIVFNLPSYKRISL